MFKVILIIFCFLLSGCWIDRNICKGIKYEGKLIKAIRTDYESLVKLNEINIRKLENINDIYISDVKKFNEKWYMTENWRMLLELQKTLENICDNRLK